MTAGFYDKDDNEIDAADSSASFWGVHTDSSAESTQTEAASEAEAASVDEPIAQDAVEEASPSREDDIVPPWLEWRRSMGGDYEYEEDYNYNPLADYVPLDDASGEDREMFPAQGPETAWSEEPEEPEEPALPPLSVMPPTKTVWPEGPEVQVGPEEPEEPEEPVEPGRQEGLADDTPLDFTASLWHIDTGDTGHVDVQLPQVDQPITVLDVEHEDDGSNADSPQSGNQVMANPAQGFAWDGDTNTGVDVFPVDANANTGDFANAGEDQVASQEDGIGEEAAQNAGANSDDDGTAEFQYDIHQDRYKKNAGLSLRRILIGAGVAVALVGVYVFGVWYFSTHFLPNTRINGLDVAAKTVGAAQGMLEEETADYACAVAIEDFSTTLHGTDMQIERNEESMAVEAMQKQSPLMWPIAFVMPQNVEVDTGITFDKDAAQNIFMTAVDAYNEEKLPKSNASVVYNDGTGRYEITGTTTGSMVDGSAASAAVLADVETFNRESHPSAEAYVREAKAQDIPSYARDVRVANTVRSADIPILVDGKEVTRATADDNSVLVSIGEGSTLVVDKEQLKLWAEYTVADAVFHMDDWSFYYLDVDKFVEEFAERLRAGNVEGYEAPTYDELRTEGASRELAYSRGGWNSEMGRYIDVDLEAQFARLFDEKGTVLWESAFVSGEVYTGRSTVTGVFSIYSMQTNTVLVGMDYNGDGQPDYESYVNYWMPFYSGYGLHDATWRANFGGEYYYYNGSHGCINLPYSKAEELYYMTFVGETVNVHW